MENINFRHEIIYTKIGSEWAFFFFFVVYQLPEIVIGAIQRADIVNALLGKNGLHAFGNNSADLDEIWNGVSQMLTEIVTDTVVIVVVVVVTAAVVKNALIWLVLTRTLEDTLHSSLLSDICWMLLLTRWWCCRWRQRWNVVVGRLRSWRRSLRKWNNVVWSTRSSLRNSPSPRVATCSWKRTRSQSNFLP